MSQKEKLDRIKVKYVHWDKNKPGSRNVSDCEGCSASSGDGCNGGGDDD